MNEKDVIASIGRCGMVCALCHEANYCGGCNSKSPACAKHAKKEGCFQYRCSKQKGIAGCWECDDAPCDQDMFSPEHTIRNRAFIRFAKYEGIEELGKCVFRNSIYGVKYGLGKDYDQFDTEESVVRLLTRHYLNENE